MRGDTISDLQWMLASPVEKVFLWIRREWVWLWLAVCFAVLTFDLFRWAIGRFNVN